MTTKPPPYRRFGGGPKLRHDAASALAAYPIEGITAAIELIRTGRPGMAVKVLEGVPQEIYDTHCELCGLRDWEELRLRRAGQRATPMPATILLPDEDDGWGRRSG